MQIYLIQFQKENGENEGTPYLTVSKRTADETLNACKKRNIKAYIHVYDVKTQNKNFNTYAVAQYYNETEEPF